MSGGGGVGFKAGSAKDYIQNGAYARIHRSYLKWLVLGW